MANFTTADIKDIRVKTGAGMMDCKKALAETDGNKEEAIDWLRKKGLSAAAKKSGRVAAEGLVSIAKSGKNTVIIELNSETDFVAKNDKFQQLAEQIAKVAAENATGDVEEIKKLQFDDSGISISDKISEQIGVIGENMNLRRAKIISGDILVSYMHNSVSENLGKIAVVVALKTEGDSQKASKFGRQLAMHVAATKPESLNIDGLDPQLVEREKNVLTEQARESGKPEAVIEKMITGRIHKFYAEVVLLEQAFVIDGKTPVKKALSEAEKEIGGKTAISDFISLTLGEGVEKKEENFADEVAAVVNS